MDTPKTSISLPVSEACKSCDRLAGDPRLDARIAYELLGWTFKVNRYGDRTWTPPSSKVSHSAPPRYTRDLYAIHKVMQFRWPAGEYEVRARKGFAAVDFYPVPYGEKFTGTGATEALARCAAVALALENGK